MSTLDNVVILHTCIHNANMFQDFISKINWYSVQAHLNTGNCLFVAGELYIVFPRCPESPIYCKVQVDGFIHVFLMFFNGLIVLSGPSVLASYHVCTYSFPCTTVFMLFCVLVRRRFHADYIPFVNHKYNHI